jgi:hypothetical protein
LAAVAFVVGIEAGEVGQELGVRPFADCSIAFVAGAGAVHCTFEQPAEVGVSLFEGVVVDLVDLG